MGLRKSILLVVLIGFLYQLTTAQRVSTNLVYDSINLKLHIKKIYNEQHKQLPFQFKHLFKSYTLSKQSIDYISNSIITTCENNGFPFTTTTLDSIEFENNEAYASILVNLGPVVHIDSITINGSGNFLPTCLYACIGIKPSDMFSQKKLIKLNIN